MILKLNSKEKMFIRVWRWTHAMYRRDRKEGRKDGKEGRKERKGKVYIFS